MPCTRLQKVGNWECWSSSLRCLEHESMIRTAMGAPFFTVQPKAATVELRATSLMNYRWTRRTGTRCVWAGGGGQREVCLKCRVFVCKHWQCHTVHMFYRCLLTTSWNRVTWAYYVYQSNEHIRICTLQSNYSHYVRIFTVIVVNFFGRLFSLSLQIDNDLRKFSPPTF